VHSLSASILISGLILMNYRGGLESGNSPSLLGYIFYSKLSVLGILDSLIVGVTSVCDLLLYGYFSLVIFLR
jgi:hypothetical protein